MKPFWEVFKVGDQIKFRIDNQTFRIDYIPEEEYPERQDWVVDLLTRALQNLERHAKETT